MRQRAAAAAAATPPRSADSVQEWQQHSDHGQWNSTSSSQARQRTGYQQQQQLLQNEPRSITARHGDASTTSSPTTVMDGGVDAGTTIPGATEGATRRRRTSVHPLTNNSNPYQSAVVERHSPQHYLTEYNKNYSVDGIIPGVVVSSSAANCEAPSAPASTGGLPTNYARSFTHGATGYSSTASEVYYNQYTNHHYPIQHNPSMASSHDDNSPRLRRNNSVPNAHKLSFQHFEKSFHMDPNPLAAVHFRRALHVPDKQYREFLHGHGRDTTPLLNPICCANTCAAFSGVGFLFLIFIGFLLDTQPLFISGTLPSALKENDAGKTTTIYFVTAERLPSANSAYQASYAYFWTMVACLVYVYYERLDSLVRRRAYQEIPEAVASSASGASSTVGVVGEGLPETIPGTGIEPNPAYQVTAWNRLARTSYMIRAREWVGTAAARLWNGRGPTNSRRRKNRTKTNAKTV